jgi:hypothetical protein
MEADTPVINADQVLETVDADVLIQTGDRVQGTSRQNSGLMGTALALVQGTNPAWDNGVKSLVTNKRSCLVLISADSTGAGAEKVPKPPDTESCMKCKKEPQIYSCRSHLLLRDVQKRRAWAPPLVRARHGASCPFEW